MNEMQQQITKVIKQKTGEKTIKSAKITTLSPETKEAFNIDKTPKEFIF